VQSIKHQHEHKHKKRKAIIHRHRVLQDRRGCIITTSYAVEPLHDPSSVLSVRWCGIASRLRHLAEQEQGEEEEEAEGTAGVIDFEQAAFILDVMYITLDNRVQSVKEREGSYKPIGNQSSKMQSEFLLASASS
jgi:hypothetical protein